MVLSGHKTAFDFSQVYATGAESNYEKYIILKVEKGVVTRKSATDNAGFVTFRDAQFAAYKKTEEYRSVIAQRAEEDQKGEGLSADHEEFLREFYSER
jgi:hypothetical protein